jgi:tetratricopeptide (TPR) repeat protein
MSKVKILFLSANPTQTDRLQIDEEFRQIQIKLRASEHGDAFELLPRFAARRDDILEALLDEKPEIVHFSGHGSKAHELKFVDDQGNPALVSKQALTDIFRALKGNVRLVVLNACSTSAQAKAIAEIIDCTVGMKKPIGDDAAVIFAAWFYRALASGCSVEESLRVGKAALSSRGIPEQKTPELLTRTGVDAASVVFHSRPPGPEPVLDPRPCNLPLRSLGTLFKGRKKVLADLRKKLGRTDRSAGAGAVAVHGLGGVGKTRAALEYAWQNQADYTGLLFVSAATTNEGGIDRSAPTTATLWSNLANLAGELALEAATPAVDAQMAQVLGWLEAHPGWLLIVDNVDTNEAAGEVEWLLPRLRAGHVLITARISEWSPAVTPLELTELAQRDAVSFLLERTKDRRRTARDSGGERAAAGEIARALGGLALALEQAGAYINHLRLSLAEYLERWRNKRAELLQWYDERVMQYPASVAITWVTTFAQLAEPEQRLLRVLSWLAPEPIPLFFFEAAPLAEAIPDPRAALAGLAAFSLVRFEETADAVVVHRLVQEIARGRVSDSDRQAGLRIALDAVDASAIGQPNDVRFWPVWIPLAPHVIAVVVYADAAGLAEPTFRLLNGLGLYLKARSRLREAELVHRRALTIIEGSFGEEHVQVATSLNNLASLLAVMNRPDEAEPLYLRALRICEKSLGPDDPQVATSLNNLALFLRDTNRLLVAEWRFRRALEIWEGSLGPEHPNVASALNNLALLLQDTNRLREAEPLFRRALRIWKKSLGPGHPAVATGLNNLARLLRDTNRPAKAEPLFRRALKIDQAWYGPDDPMVAIDLGNLALLLQATDRLAEAEPLCRRHLEIFLKFTRETGHEHQYLRNGFSIYTGLLAAMGRNQAEIRARLNEVLRPFGVSQ